MTRNYSIPVRFLDWLHVLSLDAPLVAVSWLVLIEGIDALHLSASRYLVLFMACWVAYVGDRCFDAIRLGRACATGRHAFYARFIRLILPLWLLVAAATLILAWRVLLPQTFFAGIAIAGLTALHYLAVRLGLRRRRQFLLKEASVAFIFSLGVLTFAWERMPGWELLRQHTIFFLLCLLNLSINSGREMAQEETGEGFSRKLYERANIIIGAIIMIAAVPLAISGRPVLAFAAVICVAAMLWVSLRFSRMDYGPFGAIVDVAFALPALIIAVLLGP